MEQEFRYNELADLQEVKEAYLVKKKLDGYSEEEAVALFSHFLVEREHERLNGFKIYVRNLVLISFFPITIALITAFLLGSWFAGKEIIPGALLVPISVVSGIVLVSYGYTVIPRWKK